MNIESISLRNWKLLLIYNPQLLLQKKVTRPMISTKKRVFSLYVISIKKECLEIIWSQSDNGCGIPSRVKTKHEWKWKTEPLWTNWIYRAISREIPVFWCLGRHHIWSLSRGSLRISNLRIFYLFSTVPHSILISYRLLYRASTTTILIL